MKSKQVDPGAWLPYDRSLEDCMIDGFPSIMDTVTVSLPDDAMSSDVIVTMKHPKNLSADFMNFELLTII